MRKKNRVCLFIPRKPLNVCSQQTRANISTNWHIADQSDTAESSVWVGVMTKRQLKCSSGIHILVKFKHFQKPKMRAFLRGDQILESLINSRPFSNVANPINSAGGPLFSALINIRSVVVGINLLRLDDQRG